ELCPRRRARAAHVVGAPRQGQRAALARDRRGNLRVHQHAHHDSGALMAEPTRTPEGKLPAAPVAPEETLPWLEELPPRKIVAELDRYIVGQEVAKKAVAIAVRNRWRRSQAPEDIRDEVLPNNISMIRPTGVGTTPTHPTAAPPHPPQGAGSPKGVPAGPGEQGAASRPLFVVSSKGDVTPAASEADVEAQERRRRTREKLRQQLKEGTLEEREVEI